MGARRVRLAHGGEVLQIKIPKAADMPAHQKKTGVKPGRIRLAEKPVRMAAGFLSASQLGQQT